MSKTLNTEQLFKNSDFFLKKYFTDSSGSAQENGSERWSSAKITFIANLEKSFTETDYKLLCELITQHDKLYHQQDKPILTDFDYDRLYQLLLHVEKLNPTWIIPSSPSKKVGGQVLTHFEKASHRKPMLSLANSYNGQDLLAFDERVRKFLNLETEITYFCEPKFDGLSMELVYENGLLTKAITRGDGLIGELVTENIKTIKSIPHKLKIKNPPALLEVRGEVLIHKKDFLDLNLSQENLGLQTFANPRNAAAGTVRQLDTAVTADRPLKFYAYALGDYQGVEFKTQSDIYSLFKSFSLPTKEDLTQICHSATEVVEYYNSFMEKRHSLEFDTDGIVVKVFSLKLQEELGFLARSPRWATAAKFPPEQGKTQILEIVCQVGRTGAITPVAIMKPVKIAGVTISNATLHNQEEIDRKDVRVGDTIIIQRAGDVIPEIVEVVLSARQADSIPYKIPDFCPSCHHSLSFSEEEVAVRCTNSHCPGKLKESLKHFASRRAMNIEKLGDRWIDIFVDKGLVKHFSDFYKLRREDLLQLERQGEKSADNMIASIEKSKKTTLARFIFSLGIRFIGETTAKHIANHFIKIDNFINASEEELRQVPEIGPKVTSAIFEWFLNKENLNEIKSLIACGVSFEEVTRNTEGPLKGKSFLITGTLPLSRDDAKNIIEKNGGKILSSVSSKLNYLVVGDDPGSKLEKAQNLKVTIINWNEVEKML
ncbi:MAG: NAD-dependent DNA ligase LigA [Bdellovibrionaceae bacterium]|nr:NAD-dependent DNA ligase LigA [Pseudobdellovibrionaceae bacterium]NUM57556.1 NAD-dependent DNA ligase LigA [Pseudobdellovibrionaceae bacterium]